MQLGIIGLGKMGGNIALQCAEKGIAVVGKARSPKPDLQREKIDIVTTYEDFFTRLALPRIIFLSIPAGPAVDDLLSELKPFLKPGDIIIDGGNSYYRDSIRRYEELKSVGIFFIDSGTSGGVSGARNGACFMVGGDKEAVVRCRVGSLCKTGT